jgi:hypothetical protein
VLLQYTSTTPVPAHIPAHPDTLCPAPGVSTLTESALAAQRAATSRAWARVSTSYHARVHAQHNVQQKNHDVVRRVPSCICQHTSSMVMVRPGRACSLSCSIADAGVTDHDVRCAGAGAMTQHTVGPEPPTVWVAPPMQAGPAWRPTKVVLTKC